MRLAGKHRQVEHIVRRIVLFWARLMLWQNGCSVLTKGQQHIPYQEPFVVVANHQSLYDIPILVLSIRTAIGFVAKRQLFYIPALNFWMRNIHSLRLDRDDPQVAAAALRQQAKKMRKAKTGALVVFPEGTRNRRPWLGPRPFKPGSMRLITQEGLTALPVTIVGSEHVGRCRMKQVEVHIHPPQRLQTSSALQRRAFSQALYATISDSWHAS